MLLWMVFILSYAHCFDAGLYKCPIYKEVLKASVGELFEVCVSDASHNFINMPSWMCRTKEKKSTFQGVPLLYNVFEYFHHDPLSILVVYTPQYNFNNQCKHNTATVLLLLSHLRMSAISSCDRIKLWKKASNFLPERMVLAENIKQLKRSLTVLTMWPPGFNTPMNSAIIYFIGCGSIKDSRIKKLKYLEKQINIDNLSNTFHFQIKSWIIADIQKPTPFRARKSQYSLSASSMFYVSERLERQQWSESKVIIEGSGMYDQPSVEISEEKSTEASIILPKKDITTTVVVIPKVTQSNTMPVVRSKLKNVTIYIGSKLLYNISPDTYVDNEDGYGDKMTLKVFIRSFDMNTDFQVTSNNQNWIYYLPDQQVIIIQPRRNDGGFYNLVVCAYDSDYNRVCDGASITVLKPESITETITMMATPGELWLYQLPERWAEAVNSSERDTLDITVESSSLFEWMANASTIRLITEAYMSKEYKLKVTAESVESGRKLILLITVNSVGHNPYTSATSVQIIIRLRPIKLGNLPFSIIKDMKESLSSIIARHFRKRYYTPENILIYEVIDGPHTLNYYDIDKSLTISFIYVPKISLLNPPVNVKCSVVIITQELLSQIQNAFIHHQNIWILEYVKLKSIPGKCKQDLKFYENSYITSTTAPVLQISEQNKEISTWLNKTINITVRNGFIFKKIIIFSFQPEYNLIQKMELFEGSNLITKDHPWISLLSTEYALYGLPLSDTVRSQPYNFRLEVNLKSGATQPVYVIIFVEAYIQMFGHRFEMVISVSENDAMGHGSTPPLGELLLSRTLSYRWLLVQTLGSYLQSGRCLSQCGMDIYTHGFSEPRTWRIIYSWSVLFNTADSEDSPSVSQLTCNFHELKLLLRSLFITDPSTDSMLSMFPSNSNFSSRPNNRLAKAFISSHLGTPSVISNHISSQCFSHQSSSNSSSQLWSNITVFQGTIFAIQLTSSGGDNNRISYAKIYDENNTISTLEWMNISEDGKVLYGLPLYTDLTEISTFSLRIKIGFLSGLEKNILIRITVLPNIHIEEKTHMILMTIQLKRNIFLTGLLQRINVVRLINQYIHPSCTLINTKDSETTFKFFDMSIEKMKPVRSCEKAEDVVLHYANITEKDGETNLIMEWSQTSFEANRSYCNIGSVYNMNLELFQKNSLNRLNEEFTRFFSNSGLGLIRNAQLCLYGECSKGKLISKECISKYIRATPSTSSSPTNTKVVLLVLFLIIVVVACICLGIYFVKRGKNDGDRVPDPKSVEKSPLPTVSKKPKKLIAQETTCISLNNNSPTTPLLSPFLREDSKFDRHLESNFSNEDATGSYSFAASKNKSPEPELTQPQEDGVPMQAIKQPSTSNVIRNPAMMMGSRLNPYRNIPPSIK